MRLSESHPFMPHPCSYSAQKPILGTRPIFVLTRYFPLKAQAPRGAEDSRRRHPGPIAPALRLQRKVAAATLLRVSIRKLH